MSIRNLPGLVFAALLTAATPVLGEEPAAPSAAQLEFFETQIRPLLAFNCVPCHGPEEQNGNLRLDHISTILKGGDTGPAIVPGKPNESLLIDAINYGTYQMPPLGKLPPEEIAILSRWIADGAVWPDEPAPGGDNPPAEFDLEARKQHWSFQPITPTAPPVVANHAWPRDPLDNFILAKLEAAKLRPASAAKKRTLIRRVYFDLVGLPPSPGAVNEFLADDSPLAYARVVDGLLASPAFGQRWGRHWLDLVRYADTLGHEFDWDIPHAWRYRDYVVRAINADVPYDDFVREHIAGDLLVEPRRNPVTEINESIIATGFWHLHEDKHGPVDARLAEALRYDNQIDVFGKAFLGLTIACARCHDHKFDPITAADYYALAGFLKSSRRHVAALDPGGEIETTAQEIEKLRTAATTQRRRAVANSADEIAADLRAAIGQTVPVATTATQRLARWTNLLSEPDAKRIEHPLYPLSRLMDDDVAAPAVLQAIGDALAKRKAFLAKTVLFEDFTATDDWFASGWAFDKRQIRGRVATGPPEEAGSVDSRRLALPLAGTLRSADFTIGHRAVWIRLAGEDARIRLVVDGYQMDVHSPLLFAELTQTINTKGKWRWLRIEGDLKNYLGHRGYFELLDEGDGWLAVDEIRFTNSPDEPPPVPSSTALSFERSDFASSESLVAAYRERLKTGAPELGTLLIEHDLLPRSSQLAKARQFSAAADALAATLPEPIFVLAMQDGPGCDEELFIRGNHKQTAGTVPRRFLEALAGAEQPVIQSGSGRLQLANRLLATDNPLPARVKVNRVWHHLFGRGIVPSVDNLGVLGKEPSHPELLDYLAADFREHGWSVKRLIRRIVLSQTYRMDSTPHPATLEQARKTDPTNTLLYSQRIRRLEGEAIRDAILAVSGELNPAIGGESVPVHLTEFSQGRGRPKTSGPLDGNGRRSLYIRVQRNFLTPMLTAFDFPLPATTVGKRNVSNVPAQALILLNDPFVIDQSRKWAAKLLDEESKSPESRIEELYVAAYSRKPTPEETSLALNYLKAIGGENWRTNEEAWADYCHVLINGKEFIFVR